MEETIDYPLIIAIEFMIWIKPCPRPAARMLYLLVLLLSLRRIVRDQAKAAPAPNSGRGAGTGVGVTSAPPKIEPLLSFISLNDTWPKYDLEEFILIGMFFLGGWGGGRKCFIFNLTNSMQCSC